MTVEMHFKPINSKGAARLDWRKLPKGWFGKDADIKPASMGPHTCVAGKEGKKRNRRKK